MPEIRMRESSWLEFFDRTSATQTQHERDFSLFWAGGRLAPPLGDTFFIFIVSRVIAVTFPFHTTLEIERERASTCTFSSYILRQQSY